MAPELGNSLDTAFDKGLQLAFPPVMVQLLKALLEPSPSFATIANYLNMDPMLAGRVLHIVNTTKYGFTEKVTDLQRAAIAIGTSELFKLILALSLQKKLNPTRPREPELIFGDWRLTLWSALAAEAIAGRLCPKQSREAYLAGILKDIPLFLGFCLSEVPPFLEKDRYATLPEEGQFANELALWGLTHPEMSRNIFQLWGFSDELTEAVSLHHDYDNVSTYPPLVQSVIYATRWAELLHAPQPDLPRLILFELDIAASLGLSPSEMGSFRTSCAERFNLLLGQLGISQTKPELRLHDQSLSKLQSHYFLALGMLGDVVPKSHQSFALALQRQLRMIWGIREWDLHINLKNQNDPSYFRCRVDGSLFSESPGRKMPPPKKEWHQIPISRGKRNYGLLIVPPPSSPEMEQVSLPMFMSMLAMHLDNNRKFQDTSAATVSFENLPFVIARLDKHGNIMRASSPFLDIFKLSEAPVGMHAGELLSRHLDIELPLIEGEERSGQRSGFFLSVPEGHFPGTPLYLARSPAPDNKEESYLFLGDVTRMNSQQALAMAHSGLLGTLFDTLNEQVALLDEDGRLVWTDESCRELLGRNIFSLSKPELSSALAGRSLAGGGRWNSSFLASLATSTRVQVMLAMGGTLIPYTLTFSPLEGKAGRQYLLMLHNTPPQSQQNQEQKRVEAVKAKDSLTDLYGYSQFHMLMKHMAEQARKHDSDTGIIFCDIEGLHKFNALHGCQKGDIMLRRVAGCLAENCRPGQDHACRYGSDKFAVIVHRAARPLMDALAEDIHRQVLERCGEDIILNIGLVLISPHETPKARLDAARRASEQAAQIPGRTCWAD